MGERIARWQKFPISTDLWSTSGWVRLDTPARVEQHKGALKLIIFISNHCRAMGVFARSFGLARKKHILFFPWDENTFSLRLGSRDKGLRATAKVLLALAKKCGHGRHRINFEEKVW